METITSNQKVLYVASINQKLKIDHRNNHNRSYNCHSSAATQITPNNIRLRTVKNISTYTADDSNDNNNNTFPENCSDPENTQNHEISIELNIDDNLYIVMVGDPTSNHNNVRREHDHKRAGVSHQYREFRVLLDKRDTVLKRFCCGECYDNKCFQFMISPKFLKRLTVRAPWVSRSIIISLNIVIPKIVV